MPSSSVIARAPSWAQAFIPDLGVEAAATIVVDDDDVMTGVGASGVGVGVLTGASTVGGDVARGASDVGLGVSAGAWVVTGTEDVGT